MPRTDARHNRTLSIRCPQCRSTEVTAAGPVRTIRWIDKAPAQCGACGTAWLSENKRLVEDARVCFGEAA